MVRTSVGSRKMAGKTVELLFVTIRFPGPGVPTNQMRNMLRLSVLCDKETARSGLSVWVEGKRATRVTARTILN